MKRFSKRNLELIRQWYLFYNQETTIAKQAVSQLTRIPWGHNIAIISKTDHNWRNPDFNYGEFDLIIKCLNHDRRIKGLHD